MGRNHHLLGINRYYGKLIHFEAVLIYLGGYILNHILGETKSFVG